MKTLKFTMLLILLLLAIPNLVHARPEGVMVKEWKEVLLNSSKKQRVVSKLVPLESILCEVEVINLDPEFPLYFVETSCLSWALTIIPNLMGVLYCNLGFWADDNTYAIFSAVSGNNGLKGWQYCSEV